jgi:hypothetical protein
MLNKLIQLATGTVVVPVKVYLNKSLRCRKCGQMARLARIARLAPSGVRGYYQCPNDHLFPIDRDKVSQQSGQTHDRIFFS